MLVLKAHDGVCHRLYIDHDNDAPYQHEAYRWVSCTVFARDPGTWAMEGSTVHGEVTCLACIGAGSWERK